MGLIDRTRRRRCGLPTRPPAASAIVAVVAAVAVVLTAGAASTAGSGFDTAALAPERSPGVAVTVSRTADEPARDHDGVRTGPDPTGRDIPSRSQRVIDSAVWLWLLTCTGFAVGAVLRTWWRAPSARGARREHPESDDGARR